MMIGIAVAKVTVPDVDSACRIPIDADEDWRIAVMPSPTSSPRKGFENIMRMLVNVLFSASGDTALDIELIPIRRIPNERRMAPTFLCLSFLLVISIMSPMSPITGAKFSGLNSWSSSASLCIPDSDRSHAVIVVPILAPRMTPTDCSRLMIPEFTKPTHMTIVAPDDWMTAVTSIPRSAAFHLLLVRPSRIFSSLPPDTFFSASPKYSIP